MERLNLVSKLLLIQASEVDRGLLQGDDMTLDDVRPFLEENHRGVVTTFRRNGAAQMSILASGLHQGSAVFVVSGNTVVVEGDAEIHSWDNTGHEELRLLLRRAYTACGGGEHPDWDEYDRVMKEDRRAVVMVRPGHIYGLFR